MATECNPFGSLFTNLYLNEEIYSDTEEHLVD